MQRLTAALAAMVLVVVLASGFMLWRGGYLSASPAPIEDPNYAGWRGCESLVKPISKYMARMKGLDSSAIVMDVYWPLEGVEDPLSYVAGMDGITVIVGSVEEIRNVTVDDKGYAYVVYSVRVADVVKGDLVGEGDLVDVYVLAYLASDAMNKTTGLTIEDVASPFPLLNPGNEYVLFLRETSDGRIMVYQDFVWGHYAYLVVDGRVYSLNYISYPVELRPEEFFTGEMINWMNPSHDYSALREEALSKLSVYGESLDDFIQDILG